MSSGSGGYLGILQIFIDIFFLLTVRLFCRQKLMVEVLVDLYVAAVTDAYERRFTSDTGHGHSNV